MTTKMTLEMFEVLRDIVPEIPRNCRKIVLTLEMDKPILIEATFIPQEEFDDDDGITIEEFTKTQH